LVPLGPPPGPTSPPSPRGRGPSLNTKPQAEERLRPGVVLASHGRFPRLAPMIPEHPPSVNGERETAACFSGGNASGGGSWLPPTPGLQGRWPAPLYYTPRAYNTPRGCNRAFLFSPRPEDLSPEDLRHRLEGLRTSVLRTSYIPRTPAGGAHNWGPSRGVHGNPLRESVGKPGLAPEDPRQPLSNSSGHSSANSSGARDPAATPSGQPPRGLLR
jgi:hypothetical protein